MTDLAQAPSPFRLLQAREHAYRALELAVEKARDEGWPLPQIEALELDMKNAYRALQEARDAYAKVRQH